MHPIPAMSGLSGPLKKIQMQEIRQPNLKLRPCYAYRERSILCGGCIRVLLSMSLCTPIDCQIVLAGLACIVLSVGYSILCGDPILWGRWKWDCGKWLDHCVRSGCRLLVTLESEKGDSI